MLHTRTLWATAVLAVSLSALSACGEDAEPAASAPASPNASTSPTPADPAADFRQQLDGLCDQTYLGQRAAALQVGALAGAAEEAEKLRLTLENEAALDDDYAALVAPPELAPTYDAFKANRAAIAEGRRQLLTVAEQTAANGGERDATAGAAADEAFNAAAAERTELLGQLGACARTLSPEQEQAVTSVVREYVSSSDPARVCDQLVYPALLELLYPDGDPAAACAAELEEMSGGGQLATDISVTKVRGDDGIDAVVEFSDVGGEYDGQASRTTLYYENGEWRMFSIYLQ